MILGASQMALADVNCKKSAQPFARDNCAVQQCRDGQWVNGTVNMRSDGTIDAEMHLETDRVDKGICGSVHFILRDPAGRQVGSGDVFNGQHTCIPPKNPGKARQKDFSGSQKVDAAKAAKVASIDVTTSCGREPFGLGPIPLDPFSITFSWNF